ncbi:succinylglutamate desuccinylase [Endozoicomonas sp. G2_1]|uniref:succinylglutamate desuccinylase n=1 Tax=Endozoicomonas sp. G2_1 TaxID=2821091 RepID=UPI001ADA2AFD|nr:succinylglutamate desuccinylase [Endozoicomonas sp. G2_1]MBO9491947.1 succinylglutamate desuccinylase [Endozoicomonas sp. G2_1]
MSEGDFLSLTRQHPNSLAPSQFDVTNASGQTINVAVIDTGLISFEPANISTTTKDIVLSCAVHGNETAPIEICRDLVQQLLNGTLDLAQRVLFIFGNPAAINIGERFVEENMNRLFSGAHSQGLGLINKERERALLLEQTVEQFFGQGQALSEQHGQTRTRYHYDLHTAIRGSKHEKFAVYPFLHGKAYDKEQFCFLKACGVETFLLSQSPTTTFSYFSSRQFGAHAFTVELGKVKPFGENDQASFAATRQTLANLISDQALNLAEFVEDEFNLFVIDQIIDRHHQDFALHFADDVENFTEFNIGDLLATDGNIEHRAKTQGEAIIFPNAQVAIGQRALLTVIPTTID